MEIIAFGKIAEIIGKPQLEVDEFPTTEILLGFLHQQYPALKNQKFSIAINKKLINGNVLIDKGAEIALLPPFSGG
ncbi:MAG: MoaD/ThiS family protein [Mongoliitalea sp.]